MTEIEFLEKAPHVPRAFIEAVKNKCPDFAYTTAANDGAVAYYEAKNPAKAQVARLVLRRHKTKANLIVYSTDTDALLFESTFEGGPVTILSAAANAARIL